MDENKKQTNANRIIVIVLAVFLVLGAIKIGTLTDDVKKLKSQNSNLDSEIQMLRNEIDSIYNNVDKQLKEKQVLYRELTFPSEIQAKI